MESIFFLNFFEALVSALTETKGSSQEYVWHAVASLHGKIQSEAYFPSEKNEQTREPGNNMLWGHWQERKEQA